MPILVLILFYFVSFGFQSMEGHVAGDIYLPQYCYFSLLLIPMRQTIRAKVSQSRCQSPRLPAEILNICDIFSVRIISMRPLSVTDSCWAYGLCGYSHILDAGPGC